MSFTLKTAEVIFSVFSLFIQTEFGPSGFEVQIPKLEQPRSLQSILPLQLLSISSEQYSSEFSDLPGLMLLFKSLQSNSLVSSPRIKFILATGLSQVSPG